MNKAIIIWAASRAATASEKRIMAQLVSTAGAEIRVIAMSSLGSELLPSMVRGAVVVVVSSRKDAATALGLGADETVRVAQSVALRKSTIEGAVERARARADGRMADARVGGAVEECPGLDLLMRVLERRLGCPLDAAAARCTELAEELRRVVAIADGLIEQIRVGAPREQLKTWSNDIKNYARATLKAEALTSELQKHVERSDDVLNLLGESPVAGANETDAGLLLEQLTEFLRGDIADRSTISVTTESPCFVNVTRQTLIRIVCAAIENGLENIRAGGTAGHLTLRASSADTAILIEVTDNGVPGSTDLRPSILGPLLSEACTTRLRQVREHVRHIGGDMAVDTDEGGNIVSIYLPARQETATTDMMRERPTKRLERRNH
jgi:hypothetical protein